MASKNMGEHQFGERASWQLIFEVTSVAASPVVKHEAGVKHERGRDNAKTKYEILLGMRSNMSWHEKLTCHSYDGQ